MSTTNTTAMTASFIVPVKNEAARMFTNLQDLEFFLRKFPLQMELLLVMDPSPDATEEEILKYQKHLQEIRNDQLSIRLLKNKHSLGRSRSVAEGLQQATGDVILVGSLGWSVPLAEVFQTIQEILLTPNLDLVIGNRHTSRKKRTAHRSSWYWTLENMLKEKLAPEDFPTQDPLTPFLGFRKSARDKIKADLNLKGWFYSPDILRIARKRGLILKEIPILSQDQQPSKIPLFKEYLRNLF